MADGFGGAASDASIDFIEDQGALMVGFLASRLDGGFEGEHYAREFAARGNVFDGTHGLTGVRRDHVGDLVEAGGGPVLFLVGAADFDFELGLHGKVVDFGFDRLLQFASKLVALLGESTRLGEVLLGSSG